MSVYVYGTKEDSVVAIWVDEAGGSSKEQLRNPWRNDIQDWTIEEVNELLDNMKKTNPADIIQNVERFNVLMIGEIQSGKSSTINSIFSCLYGKLVKIAQAQYGYSSRTKKYKTYNLEMKDRREDIKITLCDSIGLFCTEKGSNGLARETFEKILDGKIPNGYEFDSDTSNAILKENPGLSDKMHCVVVIMDANNVTESEARHLLKEFKDIAEDKNISTCVIVTKIDTIPVMKNKDTSSVYYSNAVHVIVKQAAEMSGLDENDIFPIINIVRQTRMDQAIKEQLLVLTALHKIVECCSTTLLRYKNN